MKILGLDFETQHAEPKTTPVTEVGARLFYWAGERYRNQEKVLGETLATYNSLVYHPGYPPQTPQIVALTGISDDMLKAKGKMPTEVMPEVIKLVEQAEIVWVHNKRFDKNVFESLCTRLKLIYPERPWLCTMSDLPWPTHLTCHKLGHLALDMGIPMDGRELHRAINDVDLMCTLVVSSFSLDEVMDYYNQPWVYLKADIGKPWEDPTGNAAAKAQGFTFERAKGTDEPSFAKTWVKRVKKPNVQAELALATFPIIVVEN